MTTQKCLPVQHILDSTIQHEVTRTTDELNNCCGTLNCSRHIPAYHLYHCHDYKPGTLHQRPT